MFDLEKFIVTNLIEGYRSNTFNEYQVNIYASGYMLKGAITQEGFNEILQEIENIKNPPELEVGDMIDEWIILFRSKYWTVFWSV